MPFRACTVTFRDRDGVQQTAKVDAETAFEAAALALKFWSTRQFTKGPGKRAVLEVEADRPARRLVAVKVSTLLNWLYVRKPRTPEEAARIQRLRGLLSPMPAMVLWHGRPSSSARSRARGADQNGP